uniref:Intracellular protein transport protein USO1-like n=1 Tax=Elaeis guineensis var. tenera TaxID=51953 RepID=A0A6I9QLZ3_ELAGV|nr:intracellular protein transport protein USO1-like [Elaeis guineensis]
MKNQHVSDMLSSFYPMMIRLVFNISELEARYRKFGEMRAPWRDKVGALEADKVSRLKGALASSESELQSAKDDARKKSRTIRRLRHERDGIAKELEADREQLRVSLGNLAKAEEGLSVAQADADIAKGEAESAKEALSRAVEVFRDSEEYREELLESGYLLYQVRYEDAREAVRGLYPELDLSSIVLPESEAPAAEETAEPASEGLSTRAKAEEDAEPVAEDQSAPTVEVRADPPTNSHRHPVEDVDSDD